MPRLEPISPEDVDSLSQRIERLVDQTPSIDRWCSGPDWSLPASISFAPESDRYLVGDPATGIALLAAYANEDGNRTISGIEPMWGFGSPILGPDPVKIMHEVALALNADDSWDTLILPGLPVSQELLTSMARAIMPLGTVRAGVAIEREVIDLSEGVEPWFARRSSKFRRNIRRALRGADAAGVAFEDVSWEPGVFGRLQAIEQQSWKGKQDSGITSAEMATMYEMIIERLQATGRLRATVATINGDDAGFILGGVRDGIYRGLQLSYVEHARPHSLGHLLQWHQISCLAIAADANWYDLGMSIDYKSQWADARVPSPLLMVTNGPEIDYLQHP